MNSQPTEISFTQPKLDVAKPSNNIDTSNLPFVIKFQSHESKHVLLPSKFTYFHTTFRSKFDPFELVWHSKGSKRLLNSGVC